MWVNLPAKSFGCFQNWPIQIHRYFASFTIIVSAKAISSLIKRWSKILSDDINNPVNDSIKARNLFFDEVNAFMLLAQPVKRILYALLHDKTAFKSFFEFISYKWFGNVKHEIQSYFNSKICLNARLDKIIETHPVELAYCLTLINCADRYSIVFR